MSSYKANISIHVAHDTEFKQQIAGLPLQISGTGGFAVSGSQQVPGDGQRQALPYTSNKNPILVLVWANTSFKIYKSDGTLVDTLEGSTTKPAIFMAVAGGSTNPVEKYQFGGTVADTSIQINYIVVEET